MIASIGKSFTNDDICNGKEATALSILQLRRVVTYNAVKHSLLWCEARLSRAEVLAAHQNRLRLQAFARLSSRYLDELENLMSDPNPVIRSRALVLVPVRDGANSGGLSRSH